MGRLDADVASAEGSLRRGRGIMHVNVLVELLPSGVSFGQAEEDNACRRCQRRARFPLLGAHW